MLWFGFIRGTPIPEMRTVSCFVFLRACNRCNSSHAHPAGSRVCLHVCKATRTLEDISHSAVMKPVQVLLKQDLANPAQKLQPELFLAGQF